MLSPSEVREIQETITSDIPKLLERRPVQVREAVDLMVIFAPEVIYVKVGESYLSHVGLGRWPALVAAVTKLRDAAIEVADEKLAKGIALATSQDQGVVTMTLFPNKGMEINLSLVWTDGAVLAARKAQGLPAADSRSFGSFVPLFMPKPGPDTIH